MKKLIYCATAVLGIYAASAQTQTFAPGQLAVLRVGNGDINLRLKQAPVFVDQFDPAKFNEAPVLTVAIPTNVMMIISSSLGYFYFAGRGDDWLRVEFRFGLFQLRCLV